MVTFTARRTLIGFGLLLLVASLVAFVGTRKTWSPGVLDDPLYRSGRTSLCKQPTLVGNPVSQRVADTGIRRRSEGAQRLWEATFDPGVRQSAVINICSEYGSIKVVGSDRTTATVRVATTDAFPGGAVAVADTRVNTAILSTDHAFSVNVWQASQGLTAFKSWFARGARLATADVVVEVPRTCTYELHLTANHQRITVENLSVLGTIEGYASPGATVQGALAGNLVVAVSGLPWKGAWTSTINPDLHAGTVLTVQPLKSAAVMLKTNAGPVDVTVVGRDVGIEVNAKVRGRATLNIGPIEPTPPQADVRFARTLGYNTSPVRLQVHAATGGDLAITKKNM